MTLLLVNHHYVHPREGEGAIFPVSVDEMISRAKQLERDGYHYLNNFRDYFEMDCKKNRGKFFHYTFDDGLKEQYASHEALASAGYGPTYFISTSKYLTGNVDIVHLIHYVRHKYDDKKILEVLDLKSFDIPLLQSKATRQYRYDTKEAALIKYILNFVMKENEVAPLLQRLLTDECLSYFDELYMTDQQIVELAADGRIGSHSHNHLALGTLLHSELRQELALSLNYFETKGIQVDAISYPYGGPSAVPDKDIVHDYFKFGITMNRDINTEETDHLLLNRVDTNEIKLGLYQNYG